MPNNRSQSLRDNLVDEVLDLFDDQKRFLVHVVQILPLLLTANDGDSQPLHNAQKLVVVNRILLELELTEALIDQHVVVLLRDVRHLEHPLHLLLSYAVLGRTVLDARGGLVDEDLLQRRAIVPHEGDDLGVLPDISSELVELVLLLLVVRDLLEDLGNGGVKGLSLHHEGGGLQELNGPEEDGDKLRELDAMMIQIERILKGLDPIILVIKLDKSQQIPRLLNNLIIPQEVQQMLISNTKILLLIFLLIINDEVIKKDLIKFVQILLDANPYMLLRYLLVLVQVQFGYVLLLDYCPELLEGEAAQRRVCVPLFCLELFLLEGFVYAVGYLHVLLYPVVYCVGRDVLGFD